MALAPKFAGQKLTATASPETIHTVELFLDYVCPYSFKMFNTVYDKVFPLVKEKELPVQFLFRHQVQPWHPSSTLTHESALAVLRLSPAAFWPYSSALFATQKSYFDVNVVDETRNTTYARLAHLAASSSPGLDEQALLKLLKVSEKPGNGGSLNVGNAVTDDLKVVVKIARLVGVHASPTVLVDGVVEGAISSAWTPDQWIEFLEKKVA